MHEYKTELSKWWFSVRDTYGIEIALDQDDALILAVTVCIDQMTATSADAYVFERQVGAAG